MTHLTRHLRIYGRVQGIGFRWSLSTEAKVLGLDGWVRNCSDGSVEAVIVGTPEAVEALTAWAYRGPPSARVDRVLCNDEFSGESGTTAPELPTGFKQRPTF